MDNKNKFNTVKIATCNDAHKAEAVNQLFERSLLFNRSGDICGIVLSVLLQEPCLHQIVL